RRLLDRRRVRPRRLGARHGHPHASPASELLMVRGLLSIVAMFLAVGCGVGTYRAAQVTGEMQMRLVASEGGEAFTRWSSDEALALEETIFRDASHVREAHLENLPDGDRHIVLYLTADGADRLESATRENEGRRLAIVVDGR